MTPVASGLDQVLLRVQAILDRVGALGGRTPGEEGGEFAVLLRERTRTGQGDGPARAPQGALRDLVTRAAQEAGVDPRLVMAVLLCESGGDPRAVSPAGAAGLMQLMPETAQELGVTDVFDPVQNLRAGAAYLRAKLREFGGDLPRALAAYNAGSGAVRRWSGIPPYAETQHYVAHVLAVYRALAAEEQGGQGQPAIPPSRPGEAIPVKQSPIRPATSGEGVGVLPGPVPLTPHGPGRPGPGDPVGGGSSPRPGSAVPAGGAVPHPAAPPGDSGRREEDARPLPPDPQDPASPAIAETKGTGSLPLDAVSDRVSVAVDARGPEGGGTSGHEKDTSPSPPGAGHPWSPGPIPSDGPAPAPQPAGSPAPGAARDGEGVHRSAAQTQIRLTVESQDLGRVAVRLGEVPQGVTARVAASGAASEALLWRAAELRDALRGYGVPLADLVIARAEADRQPPRERPDDRAGTGTRLAGGSESFTIDAAHGVG